MKCEKCSVEYEGNSCPQCGEKHQSKGKLLGFRSNKVWKKIISIAYLVICGLVAFAVIFEGKYENITVYDFVIDKIFSFLMLILMVSPYIFLSETKFRNILPLFKKHRVFQSTVGMIIVVILILISIGITNSLHSEEYLADMQNHAYVEVSKTDATCEKDGEINYHCEYCGEDHTEVIKATGHQMVEVSRVDATEDEDGEIIRKCSVCNKEQKETIRQLGSSTTENNQPNNETNKDNNSENKQEQGDQNDYFKVDGNTNGNVTDIDMSIISVLLDAGYSMDHATAIDEILNTLGINSIEIYFMTGEAETGLNAVSCYPNGDKSDDSRFYFSTEDGVMFYAGFLSDDLYDIDQGGFIKKYGDVHIPEKEVDWDTFYNLQELAEKEVKKYLNYPNTADFGLLDWAVGRSDDHYKIIGTVDAQNAFGVEKEIHFSVWFVKESDKFIVEGVALNGERVK